MFVSNNSEFDGEHPEESANLTCPALRHRRDEEIFLFCLVFYFCMLIHFLELCFACLVTNEERESNLRRESLPTYEEAIIFSRSGERRSERLFNGTPELNTRRSSRSLLPSYEEAIRLVEVSSSRLSTN